MAQKLLELTGDVTPDTRMLERADIVCTTPEKWDGVSRNWKSRSYVKDVALLIIDEVHLLGEERGPVLEVIVSRMRYFLLRVRLPPLNDLCQLHCIRDWLASAHCSTLDGAGKRA